MTSQFSPATLITDLTGPNISDTERGWLTSPHLGGLILFTRHYQSKQQLAEFIQQVLEVNPKLLITVDHEGGRVQRFRQGFTQVPAMGLIGQLAETDMRSARQCAYAAGIVLAYELRQVGVHLTYAPVLDLDYDRNQVIGARSFGHKPETVTLLGGELMAGLKALGMAVVAKHFPGHGWVQGDSHHMSPVDERTLQQIEQVDMQPFAELMPQIDWMMPAHVVFPQVDANPAGFSKVWLQTILRGQLGFTGPIVSDDLSMQGAAIKGGYGDRAQAALAAGCNVLLACNSTQASVELLSFMAAQQVPVMDISHFQPKVDWQAQTSEYEKARALLVQHFPESGVSYG